MAKNQERSYYLNNMIPPAMRPIK